MSSDQFVADQLHKRGYCHYSNHLIVEQANSPWARDVGDFLAQNKDGALIPIHGNYDTCRAVLEKIVSSVAPSSVAAIMRAVDFGTLLHSRALPSGQLLAHPIIGVTIAPGEATVVPRIVNSDAFTRCADGSVPGVLTLPAILGRYNNTMPTAAAAASCIPSHLVASVDPCMPSDSVGNWLTTIGAIVKHSDASTAATATQTVAEELMASASAVPCTTDHHVTLMLWPRAEVPSHTVPGHTFLAALRDRELLHSHVLYWHTVTEQRFLRAIEGVPVSDLHPVARHVIQTTVESATSPEFGQFVELVTRIESKAGIDPDDDLPSSLTLYPDTAPITADINGGVTIDGVPVTLASPAPSALPAPDAFPHLTASILAQVQARRESSPVQTLADQMTDLSVFVTDCHSTQPNLLCVWVDQPAALTELFALSTYPVRMKLSELALLLSRPEDSLHVPAATPEAVLQAMVAALNDEGITLTTQSVVVFSTPPLGQAWVGMDPATHTDLLTINGLDLFGDLSYGVAPHDTSEDVPVTPTMSEVEIAEMKTVKMPEKRIKTRTGTMDSLFIPEPIVPGKDSRDSPANEEEAPTPTATPAPAPAQERLTDDDLAAMRQHVIMARSHDMLMSMEGMVRSLDDRMSRIEEVQRAVLERVTTYLPVAQPAPAPVEAPVTPGYVASIEAALASTTSTMESVVARLTSLESAQEALMDSVDQPGPGPLPMPSLLSDRSVPVLVHTPSTVTSQPSSDNIAVAMQPTGPPPTVAELNQAVDVGTDPAAIAGYLSTLTDSLSGESGFITVLNDIRTHLMGSGVTPTTEDLKRTLLMLVTRSAQIVLTSSETGLYSRMLTDVGKIVLDHKYSSSTITFVFNTEGLLRLVLSRVSAAPSPVLALLCRQQVYSCINAALLTDPAGFRPVLDASCQALFVDGVAASLVVGSSTRLPASFPLLVTFLGVCGMGNFHDKLVYRTPTARRPKGLFMLATSGATPSPTDLFSGLAQCNDAIIQRFIATGGTSTDPEEISGALDAAARYMTDLCYLDRSVRVPSKFMAIFRDQLQLLTTFALAVYIRQLVAGDPAINAVRSTVQCLFDGVPAVSLIQKVSVFDKVALQLLKDSSDDDTHFGRALGALLVESYSKTNKKKTIKAKIAQAAAGSRVVNREASLASLDAVVAQAMKRSMAEKEVETGRLDGLSVVVLQELEALRGETAVL